MEALGSFVNWDHLQGQLIAARNANLDVFEPWVQSMGATMEIAAWLGLGYRKDKRAITWPERNHEGQIVGIGYRDMKTGRKWMVEGSKHGIIFAPDSEWGGIPPEVDHPIMIVEGVTDVMACLTREIYAIGKPSATGTAESNAYLEQAVKGKRIALVAENDKGIGAVAFLKFARPLDKKAAGVWAVVPPEKYKDIREWIKAEGDDAVVDIEDQIKFRRPWSDDQSLIMVSPDVLEDTAPMAVARQFIRERHTQFGQSMLRFWTDRFYHFGPDHFNFLSNQYVRSQVYTWLEDKKVLVKEGRGENAEWVEKPYNPNTRKVNEVIDALKALPEVLVPPRTSMPMWLDGGIGRPKPEAIVAFRNGLLDVQTYLRTGEIVLHEPTPAWFSESYCDYEFNPAAIKQAQPWLDFLDDIFNGDQESIMLLQEWMFYCMTSMTKYEKFLMMVGRPSAGKGTVLDVMALVVGHANVCWGRVDNLGSRFGLYGALGKTNMFIPDAHVSNMEKGMASLEVIKTVTGRGAVDVEGKGLHVISLVLPLRFTIAVNELPNFQDTAAALRRRLMVLWFPNSYEKKADPELKDRLTRPETIQGVAAWVMIGGRRLEQNKKFTEPKVSKAIAREFERTNTPVSAFVMDECKLGDDCQTDKKKLYSLWVEWCRSRGVSPGSMISFGQKLLASLPTVRTAKSQRDANGYRAPVYVGIRPRTAMDPDTED